MTEAAFRKLALALPGAAEVGHMGHPDFRVGGRIFATMGYPKPGWAMVALTSEDQGYFVKMRPEAFVPVKGKWGEQGATNIILKAAVAGPVREALKAAYETRLARSRQGKKPR